MPSLSNWSETIRISPLKRGGQLHLDLVKQGMQDTDELVRRLSINCSALMAHPELIPHLIGAYLNRAHASRLTFNLTMAMYSLVRSAPHWPDRP